MHRRQDRPGRAASATRPRFVAAVVIVALACLSVAVWNRLPILFPDTIGYSSAGEAVLGVFGGQDRRTRHDHPGVAASGPTVGRTTAVPPTAPVPTAVDGVSEARSPYYGVVLALGDRIGGAWFAAAAQALVAAAALVLGVRRLGLGGVRALVTIGVAMVGGLAFYACVLIPDVFLGPALLALAVLPTMPAMSRAERGFWTALLVAGLLFHRGFLAVAMVVVVLVAAGWRARWFVRGGWTAAAASCLVALVAHAAVAPVVTAVYGARMASQPFVLARMIEGSVVPAYLDDACQTRHFYLCRLRDRLPMDHDAFLWSLGPDGVFNTMSLADKKALGDEANAIVLGAVAARPVAAAVEALRYSTRELFFAGIDDFAQRVPSRWHVDDALRPAIAVYPTSGIVAGDFPLHGFSRVTQALYLAALAVLAAAAVALVRPALAGRRRRVAADPRLVAAVAILLLGIVVNAAVSGTLSGIRDRYTGRIAWLASVAAAATLCHALATTRPREEGDEA